MGQEDYIARPREMRRRKLSKSQRAALRRPVGIARLAPIERKMIRGLYGDGAGGRVASELAKPENQPLTAAERQVARRCLIEFARQFPGPSRYPRVLASVARLAAFRRQWIRELGDWKPVETIGRPRFPGGVAESLTWQLACHLLCRYPQHPPPRWMRGAWFGGDPFSRPCRQWFAHVADGKNIRSAPDKPFDLTASMAHWTMLAPDDLSPGQAFRWGQARGMGLSSPEAASAVARTRIALPYNDEANAFWLDFMRWYVQCWRVACTQIGTIVDYVHATRFGEFGRAPLPGYTVAPGDNPRGLRDDAMRWQHHRMALRDNNARWPSCGIEGYEQNEPTLFGPVPVRIVELRNGNQLRIEGETMDHCVFNYALRAAAGTSAIFSLRRRINRVWVPSTTIEVIPSERVLLQARGRCNAPPADVDLVHIHRWARSRRLTLDPECFTHPAA